jgi:hypothetical protein
MRDAAIRIVSGAIAHGERAALMRGIIAAVVMLTVLPCSVVADEWPAAKVQQVFSGNGLHFVRIVPGEGYGDTVGFKGSKTGAYARGEFYEREPDRSYKLTADVALQNPVAPVDLLLSNRGYLLTFDNWHNAGYGKVVAIYRPNGGLIRTYELEAPYTSKQIEAIRTSVSSRWWRCKPFGFVDPAEQTKVYVFEHFGGTFVFDLSTGKQEYHPGQASCQQSG